MNSFGRLEVRKGIAIARVDSVYQLATVASIIEATVGRSTNGYFLTLQYPTLALRSSSVILPGKGRENDCDEKYDSSPIHVHPPLSPS